MQCFTVWSNEIEGRLDPYYVKSISNIKNIKTNYPIVTLSSLLKELPQYGANESATNGNPKTDVRYIRITDIDEFGNLKNDDWKTTTNADEKYLLKEKDVLFARSGATAGKTFIYDKNIGKAIFAGYLIRFRVDETKANPSFVFYYTQLKRYSYWLKLIQRPSGQPNINAEEFKSFEIPLPPLAIQDQIVDIMQSAYIQKKQKGAEAQRLLDSIDSYVLEELIRIDSKKANCKYIAVVLNSQVGNIQLEHLIGGGGVPFLGANNAKKLKVPLPPLEIQNKIAGEVKRRISEAERLKAEAGRLIEEAKKQVEKMILGD